MLAMNGGTDIGIFRQRVGSELLKFTDSHELRPSLQRHFDGQQCRIGVPTFVADVDSILNTCSRFDPARSIVGVQPLIGSQSHINDAINKARRDSRMAVTIVDGARLKQANRLRRQIAGVAIDENLLIVVGSVVEITKPLLNAHYVQSVGGEPVADVIRDRYRICPVG